MLTQKQSPDTLVQFMDSYTKLYKKTLHFRSGKDNYKWQNGSVAQDSTQYHRVSNKPANKSDNQEQTHVN